MKKKIFVILFTLAGISLFVLLGILIKNLGDESDTFGVSTQYINSTGGYGLPKKMIVRSMEELKFFYENQEQYHLDRKEAVYDETIGFLDACDRYTEEYFEEHILVILSMSANVGDIRYHVTDACMNSEQKLEIKITLLQPNDTTLDSKGWFLFIEPAKGIDVANEEEIEIVLSEESPEVVTYFPDGSQKVRTGSTAVFARFSIVRIQYQKNETCKIPAEYTIDIGTGVNYELNLSEGCIRCKYGHADLSEWDIYRLKRYLGI